MLGDTQPARHASPGAGEPRTPAPAPDEALRNGQAAAGTAGAAAGTAGQVAPPAPGLPRNAEVEGPAGPPPEALLGAAAQGTLA
eukprot:349513-Lingulodinium_polyedra.AAC.1